MPIVRFFQNQALTRLILSLFLMTSVNAYADGTSFWQWLFGSSETPASASQPNLTSAKQATLHFSHFKHIKEEGLECTDCHNLKGPDMLPKMAVCSQCHDEAPFKIDPKGTKVGKECFMCHLDKKFRIVRSRDVQISRLDSDYSGAGLPGWFDNIRVNFNHQKHVGVNTDITKDRDCKICHPGIEDSKELSQSNYPTHNECRRCHDIPQYATGPICSTCHGGGQGSLPGARYIPILLEGGNGMLCAKCHGNVSHFPGGGGQDGHPPHPPVGGDTSVCNKCHP